VTLRQHLDTLGLFHVRLIEKDETVSTSTDCRQEIELHPSAAPLLINAKFQTGGRGRQGKQFSSPEGGLYMSLAVRAETDFSHSVRITSAAATAVCRAVESVTGLSCEIKWVNDIYKNGKKLCGILTEAINDYTAGITQVLIIGVGINLVDHPQGMNATDLLSETGQRTDRDRLCATVTKELLSVLDSIKGGCTSYMDEYRRRSCVIGREIRLIQGVGECPGTAVGIDDEGGLLVAFPDGHTETLTSGEITLRFAETNQ